MKNPKFSIVIPFYNTGNLIKRSIESVLNQSCGDWELLLCDDGSSDIVTNSICSEYVGNDKRIRLLHLCHKGPFFARAEGVRNSTGDYLVFLDSDDSLSPQTLDILLNKINGFESPDIILYKFVRIQNNSNKVFSNFDDSIFYNNFYTKDQKVIFERIFSKRSIPEAIRKAVKNTVIKSSLPKDDSFDRNDFAEDLLLTFLVASNSNSLLMIDDYLYYYFDNQDSITHHITFERVWNSYSIDQYIFTHSFQLDFLDDAQRMIFLKNANGKFYNAILHLREKKLRDAIKIMKTVKNDPFYLQYLKNVSKKELCPTFKNRVIAHLFSMRAFVVIWILSHFKKNLY